MSYEVGSAYLTILPSARGFSRALSNELGGTFTQAGTLGAGQIGAGMTGARGTASFRGAGARLGGVFAAAFAALAAVDIVGKTVDYVKDSINAASDLYETQNKVQQVFGSSAKVVEEFANDSTRNILLTRQAALDAASTFGIFAQSAGLSGDEAANFSTQLTALASDFSSFYNTDVDTAITAIGAALRGESEPIRQYGVLLDDATLKARALDMGLLTASVDEVKVSGARLKLTQATKDLAEAQRKHGKSSDEYVVANQRVAEAQQALDKALGGSIPQLTTQQRVLAAQAEILAQTTTAQGDAARTANGYANQQRILNKNLEDTKAQIGSSLLPVVSELTGVFSDVLLPILKNLGQWFEDNQDTVRTFVIGVVSGLLALAQGFVTYMGFMSRVQDFWITLWTNMAQTFLNSVEFILDGAANMLGWVPGLGPQLRGAQQQFQEFRDGVDAKFTAIRQAADIGTQGFDDLASSIGDIRAQVQALDGSKANITITANGGVLRTASDGSFRVAGTLLTGRASGGPMVAGRPYVTGEQGPEIVVPDRNSYVIPARQSAALLGSSGGQSNTFNITQQSDPVATAAAVSRRLEMAAT